MFQDFSESSPNRVGSHSPGSLVLEQVSDLVSRYPNLSEIELARLINLYRDLSALDVALMISDDELAPKVQHFVGDHRKEVRPPFGQYGMLLLIALCGIGLAAWAAAFAS
jgi:hypothetical protein